MSFLCGFVLLLELVILSLTICVYLIVFSVVLFESEAVESSEIDAENRFQH